MLIEMNNVGFKRDGKTILEGINWKVSEGEHWAILGMNGAGKTTLLNLVCGYLYPSKGTISVFEKPFGRYPLNELRKKIGWVSASLSEQMRHHTLDTGLALVLSGKYASIGLYEEPASSDIEKALDLMAQLGISQLKDQTYESMSQGEKQRTLIGRALMASPELLILDEPCTGLDFLSKEQLQTIQKLASDGNTTIIYVTHQVEEILPIFTKTMLLRNGTLFSKGSTDEQLRSEILSHFCNTEVNVTRTKNRYFIEVL